MSRTLLPYQAGDISALARTLKNELVGLDHAPGHVELLNMLARTRDGATYRRRERRPPADATALIGAVSPRW